MNKNEIFENNFKKKKSNFLFQSKDSKTSKKIAGSVGYFEDQSLIFHPPCCFLKLEDFPPSFYSPSQSSSQSSFLTQKSFWISDSCMECHWIENKVKKICFLGFGYFSQLFNGCTKDNICDRGEEVIELLKARENGQRKTESLTLPQEYPLQSQSSGNNGYVIKQLSRKIQSSEFWDIEFRESVKEPFVLELHIKALGNQQSVTTLFYLIYFNLFSLITLQSLLVFVM